MALSSLPSREKRQQWRCPVCGEGLVNGADLVFAAGRPKYLRSPASDDV
ncbi:hypothetical protein [Nodosilinea sp. P-1105]|nr:hypothetical protein [Nodosilinea sp. P-1105]